MLQTGLWYHLALIMSSFIYPYFLRFDLSRASAKKTLCAPTVLCVPYSFFPLVATFFIAPSHPLVKIISLSPYPFPHHHPSLHRVMLRACQHLESVQLFKWMGNTLRLETFDMFWSFGSTRTCSYLPALISQSVWFVFDLVAPKQSNEVPPSPAYPTS